MSKVEQQLLDLLPNFESFFARVGFKRIDGAIFGLLTFSESALSSEEIESILGLSQSAVSQSLKTLTLYSMIETIDHKDIKRLKLHYIKDDAISIVASVLKKRETEYLRAFEKMSIKAMNIVSDNTRKKRIGSILITTRFAKTISEFLVDITEEFENPYPLLEKVPPIFNMIKKNIPSLSHAKEQLNTKLKDKLDMWFSNGETK